LTTAAKADSGNETCFPLFRKAGAFPNTSSCELTAAGADVNTGTFFCPAGLTYIERCCGGMCEVGPLNPVTDPESMPFEDQSKPVREDKLSDSMKDKLNCMRVAVANSGGGLSMNSAWRPQTYQDHLKETVEKWERVDKLWNEEHIIQCKPRWDEISPHKHLHGLGSAVAKISSHTTGNAFDANWAGVTTNQIDQLASSCKLVRPLPIKDKIHFTDKKGNNMWLEQWSIGALMVAASGPATAAPLAPEGLAQITVSAYHQLNQSGQKVALYKYRVTNQSPYVIRGFEVGTDSPGKSAKPLIKDVKAALYESKITQPADWTGEVVWLEESFWNRIFWNRSDEGYDGIQPGQTAEFTVQTRIGSLPQLTNTLASLGFSTFQLIGPQLFQLTPSDTTAPSLSTRLSVGPAPERQGWLRIDAMHTVQDNTDPFPEVVLSKISSNQAIKNTDIEAVLDEETQVFYLKQATGRTYSVTYTAVDASGNKKNSVSVVNAAPRP
jgi:hypothetical protein